MNLRQLQDAFQDYVLALKPDIEPQITGRPDAPAAVRLEIYAQAYRLRLVEVLRDNFPVLAAWQGEDEFDRLAMAFIDGNPSSHFSARWFGDRLEGFLRSADPYVLRPELAEMAALEWALAGAFDAGEVQPLGREDLASLPAPRWPGLRFHFQPGLHRLDLEWNVADIWLAVQEARDIPAARGDGAHPLLIWRQDLKSYFRLLSVPEARALDAARKGRTFAELCDLLSAEDGDHDVAAEAAGMLQRWVEDELLVKR